ncbi:MAG: protein tyrosine phosphatase family protein [Xanthomonadaceae bacterium]|nr:protein tyrosine phosphatase family protein [Xanthomonadaceae bacterium]
MTAPLIDIPYPFVLGNLLAAGQPDEATLRAARDAGYTTVVNLRTDGEPIGFDERAAVEKLGMRYLQIPVAGAAGVTEENARALWTVINDAAPRPVLVHCGTANRVGALVALASALDGADLEDAIIDGRRAGLLGLEPTVRSLIAARG